MKYVTGIHALNLGCKLDTSGDWHCSGIQWERPNMAESDNSFFGDYGIETNRVIPDHEERYNVANHIRALLDLLLTNQFAVAQGMNDDFICNDKYDEEVFGLVFQMRTLPNWPQIDSFMAREYKIKWVKYLKDASANAK